jgi:hypothetical protein
MRFVYLHLMVYGVLDRVESNPRHSALRSDFRDSGYGRVR